MSSEILVVSGLPRSGTSLMMQMLVSGGIEVLADQVRTADRDNPRGYFEFEQVKRTRQDPSWVQQARGKAVKMVSQLLYDLPASEKYRILFMERDIEEMLLSQEKMLTRLGRPAAPAEEMQRAYAVHLERLHTWLARQEHMPLLRVSYNALLADPEELARRINTFLGDRASVPTMVQAIDPSLYRNRKAGVGSSE